MIQLLSSQGCCDMKSESRYCSDKLGCDCETDLSIKHILKHNNSLRDRFQQSQQLQIDETFLLLSEDIRFNSSYGKDLTA